MRRLGKVLEDRNGNIENDALIKKKPRNTQKYYEIPQKRLENTERMCYIISSVLKNRRIYAMDNYMEDWIGIEAAASYLDVTKDTIRNWIKKTDIPAHKIGKLWKFKRIELDVWVKSGRSAID